MVASVSALGSAGQAAHYYEADDYYAEGGEAPSAWFGKAAETLGLSGEVNRETFAKALEGRLPGVEPLGTTRGGQLEHRPGWDVTFSAPKSVSVMAEVAGDRRLVGAHDRAVKVALDYLERHGAATRVRKGGAIRTVETGKLAVATFRHNTSRAHDPQLHTHSVILNATQDGQGRWRSVESLAFFKLYKDAGAVYRQALASEAKELGYGVREGKDSMFELAGVPEAAIREFSGRSTQIEARLAERGKTRADASAIEKAAITLETRDRKMAADRDNLVPAWRVQAEAAGFGEAARAGLIAEAERRAEAQPQGLANQGRVEAAATQAVAAAARSLAERESVFTAAAIEARAGDYAIGRATSADIVRAIGRAERNGELIARDHRNGRGAEARGFTTREAVTTERRMLAIEADGHGRSKAVHHRIDAARIIASAAFAAEGKGYAWTLGQRKATAGLLVSRDRVVGVQGYAGTAKTTTVLATYAEAMRNEGFTVRAFAPTAAAATLLGEAVGAPGQTVARLNLAGEATVTEARRGGREAWIVDEASMVSARDMTRLLGLAERAGARVVLVGDIKQLGSVEAGRAFGQLQDAGMATFKLDEIVRQTNELTREAVLATIAGDGRRALEALDQGGGKVIERAEAGDRYADMARDFAALSSQERVGTLVMDPTREGRERLTEAIRDELKRDGTLGDDAVYASTLESSGLTREEARHARHYEAGDLVTFRRDYAGKGVERGEAYQVAHVDAAANRIQLRDARGQAVDWQLDKWGRGQVDAFVETRREFRAGDRIQFTRNDQEAGRINGATAMVKAVDAQARTMTLRDVGGREHVLQLDATRDQHVRHGWVGTIHAMQGATAERSMAHLESFRANTVDARAAYVAISRARQGAVVYTDNREKLAAAIDIRAGERQAAISMSDGDKGKANKGGHLGLG